MSGWLEWRSLEGLSHLRVGDSSLSSTPGEEHGALGEALLHSLQQVALSQQDFIKL